LPADQEQTTAGSQAARDSASRGSDGASPLTFRSPFAVVIWWAWLLFALGNLIDLAVQGRDHFSVVAAFILVLVTGVVYTTAQRPRILAADDGLTIVNPFRQHRIGWAAVTAVEATDLVRVRCEWPDGSRVIYSWAVGSSRRRQATQQMRANRSRLRPPRVSGSGRPFAAPAGSAESAVLADVGPVVSALRAYAERARAVTPRQQANAPVSTWCWTAVAAIVIPALALVIAVLA
jgi:hypothetical protein